MLIKIRSKKKETKELIGTTTQKEQNKFAIDQKVVEELLPDWLIDAAEIRDYFSNKIGLKNMLEFLCKYGCEDYE